MSIRIRLYPQGRGYGRHYGRPRVRRHHYSLSIPRVGLGRHLGRSWRMAPPAFVRPYGFAPAYMPPVPFGAMPFAGVDPYLGASSFSSFDDGLGLGGFGSPFSSFGMFGF
jgi:hypothetical protein